MQVSWPSHDSQPKLGQGVPSLSRNWGNGLVYTASRSTGRFHTAMHRWRGHSQGVFWEWLDGLASMLAQAPGTDHTHPKAKIVRWYIGVPSGSPQSTYWIWRTGWPITILGDRTPVRGTMLLHKSTSEGVVCGSCFIPLNRLSQETAHSISPERHKISIGSGGEIRSVLACHSMVD